MFGDPHTATLLRFVPGTLLEWAKSTPGSLTGTTREVVDGALLITDISGFTRLTTKLSRDGGAESISQLLNTFVTNLVSVVEQQGGVVLSYEGDALLAGWKSRGDLSSLALSVWRACHCAQQLHALADTWDVRGEAVTLRSAVAGGVCHLIHLRPASSNPRVVLGGPCMHDVTRCATLADSGQVLVSSAVWELVKTEAQGRWLTETAVQLTSIVPPGQCEPHPIRAATAPESYDRYLPEVLRSRLNSPLSRWLAELRTVTALFVKMTAESLDKLEGLDEVADLLFSRISHFNGDLLRIALDEGGLQALAVFGLPGCTHQDDPRRAVATALELHSTLRTANVRLSVGIATGEAFCGAIGPAHRAEYTVIGEAVNLASRLSAVAAGRILVDGETSEHTCTTIIYEGPWSIHVPGVRASIPTFVAVRAKAETSGTQSIGRLVGREAELHRMKSAIHWLEHGRSGAVLIEGEPGIGKSALVEAFVGECRAADVDVLYGAADEIERDTPYFAFRQLVRSVLGCHDCRGEEALNLVRQRLLNRGELLPFVPLLNDLLDLGLPGTPTTEQLSGSVRSDNLRQLLHELVREALRGSRILVMEDVHWLDSSSRVLLSNLLQSTFIVAVLTTRYAESTPDIFGDHLSYEHVKLSPLDEGDATELVLRHLGERSTPALEQFVRERTGGNPFFITEMCRVASRRQTSQAEHIRSDEASGPAALARLPHSARAAVLSRTDLLPGDAQVLVKLASVLGASFTCLELQSLPPISDAGIDVSRCVQHLLSEHLFRPVLENSDRIAFSHAIVREVVYCSMLAEQRRDLHTAVAQSMETQGRAADVEGLPTILSHWQRAERQDKVFQYLDRVAELRLRQYDNLAVVSMLEQFFRMAAGGKLELNQTRYAIAHLTLGEAQLNLGRLDSSQKAYEEGLSLLHLPLPRTRFGLTTAMATQICEQIYRRLKRSAERRLLSREILEASPPGNLFLIAAKAHENLTRIYYFQSDKLRLLYATLRATNLAERFPKLTGVLAVNYASLGAICGVIPLRRHAAYYIRVAAQLAHRISNPNVDMQVNLLSGLYKTSVGEWRDAERHLKAGLENARQLGDARRWSELAVSLETISGPSILTSAYAGATTWTSLVEEICRKGRDRRDIQVLGCGLVAAIRGYAVLGKKEAKDRCLEEMSVLVREHPAELELIHHIELAGHLIGDADGRSLLLADECLERVGPLVDTLNPAMKSRTLPALSALFVAAMRARATLPSDTETPLRVAKKAAQKLRRFARIYPIGRPRALLFQGDLQQIRGDCAKAGMAWHQALHEAARLEMHGDRRAALGRLKAMGPDAPPLVGEAHPGLDHTHGVPLADWRHTVESSAASLDCLVWGEGSSEFSLSKTPSPGRSQSFRGDPASKRTA
jgi:class 3 adenylate cyclase